MRLTIFCLLLLAACGDFPQLTDTLSDEARDAPFPVLSPVPQEPVSGRDLDTSFSARIASLQARASAIRQTDIGALQ